jgi:enoyl-CoA hydratase
MSDDSRIVVSRDDRVLTILIDRAEKLNALTGSMRTALFDAVRAGDENDEVGCIVIKGAGTSFCTGADLAADVTPQPGYLNDYDRSIQQDIRSLRRGEGYGASTFWYSQTPIIAQVQGYCIAAGLEMALHCDFVIAADDAKFGYPIVRNIATPPSHMFTYLMGPQWAKYLLLTGDYIDGKTAAAVGMALWSVPKEELDERVMTLARRISTVPPDLQAVNKSIVEKALDAMGRSLLQTLAIEADAIAHKTSTMKNFYAIGKSDGYKAALEAINTPYSTDSPIHRG